MSEVRKIRRALLSVYDKTGLVDFARALHEEFGIELISTGGTAKVLTAAGLPVTLVETVTGFPEMMDGRVKTLHPKIHAAILADRDNPEHMRQLAEQGIEPIDMVVVNLYPFEETIAKPGCTFAEAIEMIDIGGPCLLRAAAKNHKHVLVVPYSAAYKRTLRYLRGDKEYLGANWPLWLMTKALQCTAAYDISIHEHFAQIYWHTPFTPAVFLDLGMANPTPGNELRYGENPHQRASLYSAACDSYGVIVCPTDGNEDLLSFNNYADASAAMGLCAELARAGASGVWHRLSAGGAGEPGAEQHNAARGEVWHRLSAGGEGAVEAQQRGTARGEVWHRLSAGESRGWQPVYDETATRRNLPHLQRPGATYLVTFRLRTGTLSPAERDTVMECILHPDGKLIALHAAAVMPDHVHLLMTPRAAAPGACHSLGQVLQGIKGVSARRINQARGASGSLWLDETWDRIIRDEAEFWKTIEYIHENATRAGLDHGGPYPWCVFEEEACWKQADRGAALGEQHVLCVGQQVKGQVAEKRSWHRLIHRLIAGATRQEQEHRLIAGATQEEGATRDAGAKEALPAVCFIKHTNACGTAVDADPVEAYRRAYLGDPNAAMGGILAVNFPIDAAFAATVMETYQRFGKPLKDAGHPNPPGAFFVEVWLAPSFDEDAVAIIRGQVEGQPRKDWGQRVRLLAVGDLRVAPDPNEMDFKRIAGGVLMQTRDLLGLNEDQWQVVTQRQPTEDEMRDLRLAWLVCKHTKSNAITICKGGMLLGNGAGQMSRVMSCRIATWLAKENGHDTAGAVAASDAFFPFRDGPDVLIDAGVTALIQPGGSKRDADVVAACDERNVAMIVTGTRHFKH